MDIEVKYTANFRSLPPQQIKLKIPGWAGASHEHGDGAKAQPWHCPPFVEGSTYGLELLYPFEDCKVTTLPDSTLDFQGEPVDSEEERGCKWPPFAMFAPNHYGMASCMDLIGPPDHVLRIEPHPSYFTDHTWTQPCVIPGHIQYEFWCRPFFVVFKSPPVGQSHYFRKRQPYCQVIFVPKKVIYELCPQDSSEALERSTYNNIIGEAGAKLGEHVWTDSTGHGFDDKYKVMARIFKTGGFEAVKKYIDEKK